MFLNDNCARCADASMEQNPTHLWLPSMHALYFDFYFRESIWGIFWVLAGGFPAADGHLQGVVRGEQSGQ